MKQRCCNPAYKQYKDYGGRGIRVCERWLTSFENFLADMGECPSDLTIDRIDNDGNYQPDNCRWSTRGEQNGNRRQRFDRTTVTFGGNTLTIQEWSARTGIKTTTLRFRLGRGWPLEQVFNPHVMSPKEASQLPRKRNLPS